MIKRYSTISKPLGGFGQGIYEILDFFIAVAFWRSGVTSSPPVLTGTVTSPRVMSPILGAENLKVHRPEGPSGRINMVG